MEVSDTAPESRWRWEAWERLASRIDARVGVPGDSDTRRFQKVLVVVVAFIGSIATLFNAQTLFSGGLDSIGWAYIVSAVVLMGGSLSLLAWPRAYVLITTILLLDVLVIPGVSQVLSGGITSGLYSLPWAIFAPLGAVLALGTRHAAVHLGLFVVVVVAVAILDPYAQEFGADVTSEALLSFNVPSLLSLGLMAGATSLYLLRQVERFRNEADGLLLRVLPSSIAVRLKSGDAGIADRFDEVTVVFADIAGFTPLSSGADPAEIVSMLNSIFSEFDELADRHGMEKIKTIGDSYMAAAGLPEPSENHAEASVRFAVDMLRAVKTRTGLNGEPIRLRVGINTGPVVAGVIGQDRFIYDLWGDTVNVANRLESSGLENAVAVSEAVHDLVGDRFPFEQRDPIPLKGKGMTTTYVLHLDAGST